MTLTARRLVGFVVALTFVAGIFVAYGTHAAPVAAAYRYDNAPTFAVGAQEPSSAAATPASQQRSVAQIGKSSPSTSPGSVRLVSGFFRAAKAGRGAIELPAFTSSTIDEALTSAGRLTKGGQIQEGARAIAKKQGQGANPFAGLPQTQAQADAIIRDVLSNPTHVFRGDNVIDAYNAAGQGVRLRRGDRSFVGFLDIARRTQ